MADFRPKYMQRVVGDDAAFMDELLEMFLEDTPRYLRDMHAACDAEDADALEYSAHTLKSSCRTFGADRLAVVCQTLEERARKNQLDERTAALTAKADTLFEDVRTAIVAHRQTPC